MAFFPYKIFSECLTTLFISVGMPHKYAQILKFLEV